MIDARIAWVSERSSPALRRAIESIGVKISDVVLVKPNWFSPKPGGHASPGTLDLVLTALGGEAIVVEGGSFAWDVGVSGAGSPSRRALDRFLDVTGTRAVIEKHGARVMITSDAVLDGAIDAAAVKAAVAGRGVPISDEARLAEVPAALETYTGATLVNLSKAKVYVDTGDFSFACKNMFGLVPRFDRRDLHVRLGETCADVIAVYSALFDVVHVVEAFDEVVVFGPSGGRTEVWGRYDVVEGSLGAIASTHPVVADAEAARAFGLDPARSPVFMTCAGRFGQPEPQWIGERPDWRRALHT